MARRRRRTTWTTSVPSRSSVPSLVRSVTQLCGSMPNCCERALLPWSACWAAEASYEDFTAWKVVSSSWYSLPSVADEGAVAGDVSPPSKSKFGAAGVDRGGHVEVDRGKLPAAVRLERALDLGGEIALLTAAEVDVERDVEDAAVDALAAAERLVEDLLGILARGVVTAASRQQCRATASAAISKQRDCRSRSQGSGVPSRSNRARSEYPGSVPVADESAPRLPRTILYTGKGGVGKTSVAAATARRCAAARPADDRPLDRPRPQPRRLARGRPRPRAPRVSPHALGAADRGPGGDGGELGRGARLARPDPRRPRGARASPPRS